MPRNKSLDLICRIVGKIIGGGISDAGKKTSRWMGVALLPQAGVTIGMALTASNQIPQYRQTILTVVISATVFFEIIGTVFTSQAIRRAQQKK